MRDDPHQWPDGVPPIWCAHEGCLAKAETYSCNEAYSDWAVNVCREHMCKCYLPVDAQGGDE